MKTTLEVFEDAEDGEVFEMHYLSSGVDYIVKVDKEKGRWRILENRHNGISNDGGSWREPKSSSYFTKEQFDGDIDKYECISHGVFND